MVKQSIYQSRAHGEETPNIGRGIVNTFYIYKVSSRNNTFIEK